MTRAWSTIEVTVDRGVAELRLSRPETLNAIDNQMLQELPAALDELAADPGVSVTILSGSGGNFSSGFDIGKPRPGEYRAELSVAAERHRLRDRMTRLMSVWDHPKPVIAAVEGYCLAAATLLATFCDLTVVAEGAKIGLPSLPLGGGFISPAWVHLVGPKRAKQLSFIAGERIDGTTAADWGWANFAVPDAELPARARRLAERVALTPVDVLELKKSSVNRVVEAGGLRTLLLSGAETDVVAHHVDGIRAISQSLRAHGLKETRRRFDGAEFVTAPKDEDV